MFVHSKNRNEQPVHFYVWNVNSGYATVWVGKLSYDLCGDPLYEGFVFLSGIVVLCYACE